MRSQRPLFVCVVALAMLAIGMVGTATAKSLYMTTQSQKIASFDISGNTLAFQAEASTQWGDVGVAVDSDNEVLFITTEFSGQMMIKDPTDFSSLGTVTAPGASNLAGIVYDHDKKRLYTVDRGRNKLYAYDCVWDGVTYTLTPVSGSPFYPPNLRSTYGIALDEINDLLYVGCYQDVRVYRTSDFSYVKTISTARNAVNCAVDATNQLLYYGGFGSYNLSKYDLNMSSEAGTVYLGSGQSMMGIAVDPATSLVYITTGYNGDRLKVFDSSLNKLHDMYSGYGSPTGIAVPGKEISYNPMELAADDGLDFDAGECTPAGGSLTYTISYNNTNPDPVDGVSIAHVGGTWVWDVGSVPIGGSGSNTVALPVPVLPPGSTFYNQFTLTSTTPNFPPTTVTEQTLICTNQPPVADAGDDQTVECAGVETAATLDGSGSSDPDDDPLTYSWALGGDEIATGEAPTAPLPCCGEYAITLTVDDGNGESDSDEVLITIVDTTPPEIALEGDNPLVMECCGDEYEEPGATASDVCDPEPTLVISGAPTICTVGEYPITYTATDASGLTTTVTRLVQVIDTTPPEVTVDQLMTSLWPPNHKMQLVATATATDACAEAAGTLALGIAVTSNQDINGLGDGNTDADWEIVDLGDGLFEVWLRAERSGPEDDQDRIYTITATAGDGSNETAVVAVVTVAHDQGQGEQEREKEEKQEKNKKGKAVAVAALPTSYSLSQNAPNPFNLNTQIAFQLPEAGPVSLVIYNALGQSVRVLVSGHQAAGHHQMTWDGRDHNGQVVPSGVYLYRFVSQGLVETKRMSVLK